MESIPWPVERRCTPSYKTFLQEKRGGKLYREGKTEKEEEEKKKRRRGTVDETIRERKREESRRRQTALTTQGASVHVCAFLCPNTVPLLVRTDAPTLNRPTILPPSSFPSRVRPSSPTTTKRRQSFPLQSLLAHVTSRVTSHQQTNTHELAPFAHAFKLVPKIHTYIENTLTEVDS